MTILPSHILKLMNPKDRPKGNAGKTREEAEKVYSHKLEKDDHKILSQWLNLKDIPFIHAVTHKRSTIKAGWPDYTIIYCGCSMCIEFKVKGNKLSPDQAKVIGDLRASGTSVHVCETAKEAIEHVRLWIKLQDID